MHSNPLILYGCLLTRAYLEIRRRSNPTVGSNPTPSANNILRDNSELLRRLDHIGGGKCEAAQDARDIHQMRENRRRKVDRIVPGRGAFRPKTGFAKGSEPKKDATIASVIPWTQIAKPAP